LLKQIAQVIVSGGYKDVGYEYVIIDDCWLDNDRAADGRLQAHATQFPSGMKALADYVC
jgi:alpha-galactosidase